MTFKKITYSVADDIAVIAFNDAATMNAAGLDTVEEMLLALELAADEARCTIITGEGRAFCSGANLSANTGTAEQGKPDAGKALDSHYNPLIKMMKTHPHPIITAINGAAAGVGCSIGLMGDFIIAGKSGYFLQAFRRIGLVPDGGSTYLLTRMIGRAKAMQMTLFGEKLFADTALEWGLINQVVEDDALMATARAHARTLADGPTQALSLIRELIWDAHDNDFDSQLQSERFSQRTAGRHPDFREGVMAFLQKRPAKFGKS
ncbi:MAG: enoyl-CoA hydratase/isomerase [Henriciella sp.]